MGGRFKKRKKNRLYASADWLKTSKDAFLVARDLFEK
jgi:hypothetical protein